MGVDDRLAGGPFFATVFHPLVFRADPEFWTQAAAPTEGVWSGPTEQPEDEGYYNPS